MTTDSVFSTVATTDTTKKREFAGFKLGFSYTAPQFNSSFEMRYAKVESSPLLDVEGGLEKVGPNGGKVHTTLERHTFEGDKEVDARDIKWMQRQEDGSTTEVAPLERTASVDISEQRPIEEVTLDGTKALGTSIPREAVDKYATDSVYSYWSDEGWALKLGEYLEKQKLAALFPFTFGKD